jgi:carboxypeptidase C (cathepsin A)
MAKEKKKEKPKTEPKLKDRKTTQQFTGTFGGEEVSYTTTAGTQVFESSDETVSFFYISYTQDDVDPQTRPLVFCFNGGPGSSTVWLNLGVYGPKRMEFDEDGFKVGMQGRLVDNEHSILDVADVVCIDAMGSGVGRSAREGAERKLHRLWKEIVGVGGCLVL